MTDLIIIDDTLPIQNCHFLIKRDASQIKASPLAAPYATAIMNSGFAGMLAVTEMLRILNEAQCYPPGSPGIKAKPFVYSKHHALAELASRMLYGDVDRFFLWLSCIIGAMRELDE